MVRMVPPRWSYIDSLWRPIWDTLNIATLGTLVGMVIAFPIAFLAARNTTPGLGVIRPARSYDRVVALDQFAHLGDCCWSPWSVPACSPASSPSRCARSVSVGKLLYEAIEEIDRGQVEAIASTGASRAQQLAYGVLPQIMPAFAGISVFAGISIFASRPFSVWSARAASGWSSMPRSRAYWTQVSLMLLVIIGTVIVSEWVSAKVRHAII